MKSIFRRKLIVGVMTVLALMAIPVVVYAHTVSGEGYVWEDGNGKCVFARSSIWESSGDIYLKILNNPRKEWSFVDCAVGWEQPTSWIRVRNQLYRWDGSAWDYCASSDWFYNSYPTTEYEVTSSADGGICGAGDYANIAGAQIFHNYTWVGGTKYSGYHYFP